MSIASEIQRIQDKVNDSFDAVVEKGGTVTSRKIADLPTAIGSISGGGSGGIEWQPDPSWWDIETILKNDTEDYAGKVIILYTNSDDTITFNISSPIVAIKTSDGAFYTSTTTHTWDRTKDKPVGHDTGDTTPKFATRYFIVYLNTDTPNISTFNDFREGDIYIIFGCNLTAYSFISTIFYGNNYTLQSFKFLDNYNFKNVASFYYFCQGCRSLQKLPDNLDVSSATNFESFCQGCSLQKLPDNLDTSKGTNFRSFCCDCYSLQKLPDNLDLSSGTNFNNFCAYCYSLQKLPDNLDVSSGIDFSAFCSNCSALQKLPDNLDVSSGIDFRYFCSNCHSLQKLPDNLDVSSGTNFSNFCQNCHSLQKLPDNLDVSSGTNFSGFCYDCYSLQKLPDNLDVSSGTNFGYFCYYCRSLQKLPDNLDVSSGTNFDSFCFDCNNLQELPDVLDVSNGTDLTSFCVECFNLAKANIKLGNTSITTLLKSTKINIESLKYIADNAPTVSGKTLTIGSTNITRAGGESGYVVSTLTSKGWTVK